MKSLATCTPREFLVQSNRIRKSVQKWITDTDILKIRDRMPELEVAPKGATAEERKAVIERNAAKEKEQINENFSAILDSILEDHPDETLELLALCCFVEPEDVDNYSIRDYLQVAFELINDDTVRGFFTSLVRLGLTSMRSASEA